MGMARVKYSEMVGFVESQSVQSSVGYSANAGYRLGFNR